MCVVTADGLNTTVGYKIHFPIYQGYVYTCVYNAYRRGYGRDDHVGRCSLPPCNATASVERLPKWRCRRDWNAQTSVVTMATDLSHVRLYKRQNRYPPAARKSVQACIPRLLWIPDKKTLFLFQDFQHNLLTILPLHISSFIDISIHRYTSYPNFRGIFQSVCAHARPTALHRV